MPTWTAAPSSLRLPAATRSWSPMKALPLRPPAGKACPGTVCKALGKRWGEPFHLTSGGGPADQLWRSLASRGLKGEVAESSHTRRAERFCRAAGPSHQRLETHPHC